MLFVHCRLSKNKWGETDGQSGSSKARRFFSPCLCSYLKVWLGRERLAKTIQEKDSLMRGRICREIQVKGKGTQTSTKEFPLQKWDWAGRWRHRGTTAGHGKLLPHCFLQGWNCSCSVRGVKSSLLSIYLIGSTSSSCWPARVGNETVM